MDQSVNKKKRKKRDREIQEILSNKKRRIENFKFPTLTNRKYENPHELFTENEILEGLDEEKFLTNITWKSLKLEDELFKSLTENGYEKLSFIQAKTIPQIFNEVDLFVESPTGSGKTLSFLVPILDRVKKLGFEIDNGVCGVIVVPTRELAIQIYNECVRLMKYSPNNCYLFIGGGNKVKEAERLANGVNVMIGTPGRILDHLLNTQFNRRNLRMIVLDEADRMLEHGFEMDVKSILYKLPNKKNAQCLLFSATNQEKVLHIGEKLLKRKFTVVRNSLVQSSIEIPKSLVHGYVQVVTAKKLMLLLTFLRKNRGKKIMVFFGTCSSVMYFSRLLDVSNIQVSQIHGELSQVKRTRVFSEFKQSTKGVLFTTNVCARGLHIENVHWIIQYDPPNNLKDYVHRIGRTARAGNKGNAVLFLTKNEVRLLKEFEKMEIVIKEFKIGNSILDIQAHVEDLVEKNYNLMQLAYKTFQIKCYSYKSYPYKDIFNLKNLDLKGLATQMGLTKVPYISFEERK